MKTEHEEALSALLDGESVEPPVLAAALADPGAAATLLAFARVRAMITADDGHPDPVLRPRDVSALDPAPGRRAWLRPLRVAVPAALVGAAAVAVVVFVGQHGGVPVGPPPGPDTAGPPAPDVVVRFMLDRETRGGL